LRFSLLFLSLSLGKESDSCFQFFAKILSIWLLVLVLVSVLAYAHILWYWYPAKKVNLAKKIVDFPCFFIQQFSFSCAFFVRLFVFPTFLRSLFHCFFLFCLLLPSHSLSLLFTYTNTHTHTLAHTHARCCCNVFLFFISASPAISFFNYRSHSHAQHTANI